MKRWFSLLFLFASAHQIQAQANTQSGFYIGGYYSILVEPTILESTKDSINVILQYININLRYAISRKFRFGVEYTFVSTSPDEVQDPFYIAGLTMDYDLLKAVRSKLHFRAGISLSNLSFAGDYEPKRRTTFNRILGGSYEFGITSAFWVYAGFYHQYPLNAIPYKEPIVEPFLGVCLALSRSH